MDRNPVAPQLHNDSSDLAWLETSLDFTLEVNDLIQELQSQGFEIRKIGRSGDRNQSLAFYRDGELAGEEASLTLGLKVALKNLLSQVPYILDSTLKGHEEDVERLAYERRAEAAAALTAEREKGYPLLKSIIHITSHNTDWIDSLKVDPRDVAILREAQADGISLVDNNSRTNGFYITDGGGETIGEVRVFLNPNWQNDLIAILKKHLQA